MRQQISTGDAPAPAGAYSQGIIANGFLFTAGVGPHDPVTKLPVGTTIEGQTAQAMRNVGAVLAAAGAGFDDLVRVTVHLADLHRDFTGFNRSYEAFLTAPYPVRTTVGSTLGGFLVEIDVIAVVAAASA